MPCSTSVRLLPASVAILACAGAAACSGGGGGGSAPTTAPGTEIAKPGGGTFFLDSHRGGRTSRLHLVECVWGRLVDIHGLDSSGDVDPAPAFRDMLVQETVQSDGLDYRLETNPITQSTRLVILRQRGAADAGNGTVEELLARARRLLSPVLPKPDDGSGAGPISLVARNACISLRFDDLLEDGPEARLALRETVRVVVGYPPSTPFLTRLKFDPNHGGIAGNAFHSTRVLVDAAVSAEDAAASEFPLQVNSLGFPASFVGDERPNASIRIPSRRDPGTGQFVLLTNLAGAPLERRGNGPVDDDAPTVDVVRALRAGREDDPNSGFMLDLNRPELIGSWPVTIGSVLPDPAGTPGFDFLLDITFRGTCQRAPRATDIFQAGEAFLEIQEDAQEPDAQGAVGGVRARLSSASPLADPGSLLGGASFLSTFSGALSVPAACWVSVVPAPGQPPDRDIPSDSRFVARFSEPMSTASLDPFDNFRLVRGNPASPVLATTLVVARAVPSDDLRTFTLQPLVPLPPGVTGEYTLSFAQGPGGLTDLAGNPIAGAPTVCVFELDPEADPPSSGGVVLRFSSIDELAPVGPPDLRGQFFYDLARGRIRGRRPGFESFAVDRTQPVPSIMIPFAPGVQTPLSGFGSKLQTVWRHCDLGWSVEDETKHNLDVVGLAWTPVGGTVLSDFFERFELRLAHSRRLPDEFRTFVGTTYPCSGLGAGSAICPPCALNVPFEDNILPDPRSPQQIVHARSFGYRIEPRDLFVGVSGNRLMPWPMNKSGTFTSYTWRDTSVLAKDGLDSAGIPLLVEVSQPLALVPGPAGRIAGPGRVPAWGLPLLIEVRCFPSSNALGLNPLEIYLAQNAQQLPCFRAFTTGGINQLRIPVLVNPDLALFPEGGFNPNTNPPGKPTTFQADNSFYSGQLETVTRVSRAHTIWMEAELAEPHYLPPVVAPQPSEQPGNSRIELEFRGANAFFGTAVTEAFDARELDPLGDVGELDVDFHRGDNRWTSDLSSLDGAHFVQMRLTFVNDIIALVGPELSAVGIAYAER